jgi:hypothetical protein
MVSVSVSAAPHEVEAYDVDADGNRKQPQVIDGVIEQ